MKPTLQMLDYCSMMNRRTERNKYKYCCHSDVLMYTCTYMWYVDICFCLFFCFVLTVDKLIFTHLWLSHRCLSEKYYYLANPGLRFLYQRNVETRRVFRCGGNCCPIGIPHIEIHSFSICSAVCRWGVHDCLMLSDKFELFFVKPGSWPMSWCPRDIQLVDEINIDLL